MNRTDISYIISLILLIAIAITGFTGFIQSQLDLRKFVPHTYTCYFTLFITVIHVMLNWIKLLNLSPGVVHIIIIIMESGLILGQMIKNISDYQIVKVYKDSVLKY